MRRDDPFTGGVVPRLRRIERALAGAATDAQCRDWAADRPDRVGFARLGQARGEIHSAARRYRADGPSPDLPALLAGGSAALLVAAPVVLLLDDPGRPPVLGGVAVAALWAAIGARTALRARRRRRARAASPGPAPIDDPFLYTGLRRRIEACAVAARSDRSYRRRAAATDLEYALDWLAAAEEELPR
ncbi:hypothetical protein [Actinoplanes sp. NPDC051851]|uniref:hypothetical protein n=1 Tax=Actinoplanes sp. NPDC051851 TaxID=3154753 RepID=UPI00343C0520